MPPRARKPPPSSSNFTFLLDTTPRPPQNSDPSQVTLSTTTIASSSSNPSTTEPLEASPTTSFSSPNPVDGAPGSTTSTTRPRSRSTRGGGKKREASGHIPRPPNAFILFRSDFIRRQHIPDQVEGNHSNLSKIIGHCWKALPKEEREAWEAKAASAQEAHRQQYPDWRFRPGPYALGKVKIKDAAPSASRRRSSKADERGAGEPREDGNGDEVAVKGKGKGKEKDVSRFGEGNSTRCEVIASFLVEGKMGSQLASAVEEWEAQHRAGAGGQPTRSQTDERSGGSSPRSPSASPTASSPDRQSVASNFAHERSPDPSQSPGSSQSPSTSTAFDSSSTSDATLPGTFLKPRISSVPLTRMFVPADPSPSHPSPSIADICPSSRFELNLPLPASSPPTSDHRPYPKDAPQPSPSAYDYPQQDTWGRDEFQVPSGQGYWGSWPSRPSDLVEGSPDKQRSEAQSQREMGYETDATVTAYDSYGKVYGSNDLPNDGSEVTAWTTSAGRTGMMAIVNDPHDDPPSMFASSYGLGEVGPASDPSGHQPLPTTFYYESNPPQPSSHSSAPMTHTGTSFSSLAGWAGELPYEHRGGDPRNQRNDVVGSDHGGSSKLSTPNPWYPHPQHMQWPTNPTTQGHQMGMMLSSDDWDKVEAFDSRTIS